MKKRFISLILIALTLSVFAKGRKDVNSDYSKITGYVKIYGNEPFTYPGIETENKVIYKVVADDKVLSELYYQQGQLLIFTGTINEDEKTFELISYELKK